jgi:RNase P subunit RPR2
MLPYNGLYPNGKNRCPRCKSAMVAEKIRNVKLDNGDPDYITVMKCGGCGHSRRQSKMEYGLSWG